MALNPFFLQGSPGEQRLVQELINEQLKIYGVEVTYIPRKILGTDPLLGYNDLREVNFSKFDDNYSIEAYVQNYEGYGGSGDILTKFGMSLRDEVTLVISRERYEDFIAQFITGLPTDEIIVSSRPREGDLIYFPLGQRLFEVKFVEHENPFYQLGKNYVYELKCELYEYEDEIIDTNIEEIDTLVKDQGYITTLIVAGLGETATASAAINSANGYVRKIYLNDDGTGYTSTPTVSITPSTSGSNATAVAITTSKGGVLSVSEILIVNTGSGYTKEPTITISGGGGAGAAATCSIERNFNGVQSITLTDAGSGYPIVPLITISAPVSIGAAATVGIGSTGGVNSFYVANPGSNYNPNKTPILTFSSPTQPPAAVATAVVGNLTQVGVLTASDRYLNTEPNNDSEFGRSVAISTSHYLIGAQNFNPSVRNGRAYLKNRITNSISILIPSTPINNGYFGAAVGVAGTVVVVGTPGGVGGSGGVVYLYNTSGTAGAAAGISTNDYITAASGYLTSNNLGAAIGIAGTTIVAGAPASTQLAPLLDQIGALYIFQPRLSGLYSQTAFINASDKQPNANFGYSVGIAGTTIIVGAPNHDNAGITTNSGQAYVFQTNSSGVWSQVGILSASDIQANGYFGYSVGVAGSTIVVGAPGQSRVGFASTAGQAYVFQPNSSGVWAQVGILTANDISQEEYAAFGSSVAIDGRVIIVGAYGKNAGSGIGSTSGKVYSFEFTSSGIIRQTGGTFSNEALHNSLLGYSVAIAGTTILAGSPTGTISGTPGNINFTTGVASTTLDSTYIFDYAPTKTISSITVDYGSVGYSTSPTITISTPNDVGLGTTGATATAIIGAGGVITGFAINNAGTGYTVAPTVSISQPTLAGLQTATGYAVVGASGTVTALIITSVGYGYTVTPTVSIANTFADKIGLNTAVAVAYVNSATGVSGVRIVDPGNGYTSAPTVVIANPPRIKGIGNYEFNELIVGQNSKTTGRVKSWDADTRILKVGINSGTFYAGEDVIGAASSAIYVISSYDQSDIYDPYTENDEIENIADQIVDFSESNPFGVY
jgi:hypothetical protein